MKKRPFALAPWTLALVLCAAPHRAEAGDSYKGLLQFFLGVTSYLGVAGGAIIAPVGQHLRSNELLALNVALSSVLHASNAAALGALAGSRSLDKVDVGLIVPALVLTGALICHGAFVLANPPPDAQPAAAGLVWSTRF